jgi:hypothetical protein
MEFHGLAADFTREIVLPAGAATVSQDATDIGTATAPVDSAKIIEMTLSCTVGAATLVVGAGTGSYVVTEQERSSLCEFQVDLGLSNGVSLDRTPINFSFINAPATVTDTVLYDFTGGASVQGTLFRFGPHYGLAYMIGRSGVCVDTVRFTAPPAADGYRSDLLGNFSFGNFLSDGHQVWLYEDAVNTVGGNIVRRFRVLYTTTVVLASQPIANQTDLVSAHYDRLHDLIWIIERSASAPDTAWGYRVSNRSDSTTADTMVVAATIPGGQLMAGQWVQVTTDNAYVRQATITPFAGGLANPLGTYPAEITTQFAGGAGISLPGDAASDKWCINVFDQQSEWVARYPVMNDGAGSVTLISADSVIVYSLYSGSLIQVRALIGQP